MHLLVLIKLKPLKRSMTKHLQVTHSGQVMLKYPLKHSVVVSIRSMLCQMLNVLTLRKIMKMQMPSMRENGIYSHTVSRQKIWDKLACPRFHVQMIKVV